MIFDTRIDFIRAKQPFFGSLPLEPDFINKGTLEQDMWSWDSVMAFLDSHPPDQIDRNDEKQRFFLKQSEARASAPDFAKEIVDYMQQIFYQNSITNIVFIGVGTDSDSYPRHADTMDVFLVQVCGVIQIAVENLHNERPWCFGPGDFVYIPRGTYHQIIPNSSRVTFSFGVEHEPDPSTYVL